MFQPFLQYLRPNCCLEMFFPSIFFAVTSTVHEINFILHDYMDQHAYLCASRCFNFKKAKKFYTERSSDKQKYRWLVN